MTTTHNRQTEKYAQCIANSKRVRWDIDADVIRGREFDLAQKYLPDSISFVSELEFLTAREQQFLSQVQGRTYANMFGLVERFINCKVLEISADYWTGDQVALEALIRFSDEELKHQELFRRIETMMGATMPAGYQFVPTPNEVTGVVLAKSTWSVLTLTLLIELFTQAHYRRSIEPEDNVSALYKDVFLFHWREESQHAKLDELELRRHDATLGERERDGAVDDLIELVGAVDGILQAQADADAEYFMAASGCALYEENAERLQAGILRAYRWQYILSGVEIPRFQTVLGDLLSAEQLRRVTSALGPLAQAHEQQPAKAA
jgi:hypothetical protein